MGIVYKAYDPEIDRAVAIKLILADLLEAQDRSDFLARFRREAQVAGRCMHANIVAVYDFALHEGSPFIAMEFVDGKSLAQLLAAGRHFSIEQSAHIIGQVLAALESAHAMGIVHRDIKPANILLTADLKAKVTDFGIARTDRSNLTQSQTVLGTLSYMAPEQCRGEEVDQRADLFSVACILHELVVRQRPFPGRGEGEVINRLLNEPPAGLAEANLPPALRAVIERGLAKQADARFPTAQAMAAALSSAVGNVASADDRTIVASSFQAGPQARPAGESFDPDLLKTLERKLTPFVGPIAGRLIQSAARNAASLEALCETVARGIERPTERDRFLREATGALQTGTRISGSRTVAPVPATPVPAGSPANAPVLSQDTAALAQRELTKAIGPIAAVLVRRTLPQASSIDALWDKLASHIDSASERDAFMRAKP
jgi:serine/threonine-protein kinase